MVYPNRIMQNKIWIIFTLVGFNLAACNVYRPAMDTISNRKKVNEEDIFRQEVISHAKEYVGSRYKYAGRDPKGFDCSGFTYFVFDHYDISLSPSSRDQERNGQSIPVKEARTGDLIFFRRSKTGQVFHVALVVSNDEEGLKVIHSTSRGVVIDNISNSSYWKPKISTARNVISEKY